MREYGQVQTSFWLDEEIQQMDDDSKLFIIYILTSPHTNSLGCFRATLGYMESDLNWDKKKIIKTVSKPFVNRFVMVDFGLGWVFIPKFIKWNQPSNPNVWKKLYKDFSVVPKKLSFYNDLVDVIKKYGNKIPEEFMSILNHFEIVSKPFANKDPDPDPDPDPEQTQTIYCRTNKITDDDIKVANQIRGLIESLGVKVPKKLESWANTIRLMRELDGISHSDMMVVFKWANKDPFWQSNILSANKFREKYSQLMLQKDKRNNQTGKQLKTFEQQKVDNIKQAMVGFINKEEIDYAAGILDE